MAIHTIPLHLGDLITDTTHLSAAELGAYIRLLAAHYRMGMNGLPDDDLQLRRITGLDNKSWRGSRDTVLSFFMQNEDRRWVHGRVQETIQKITEVREQNRANALKRFNRKHAVASDRLSDGNAMAMQSINPVNQDRRREDIRASDDRFERVFTAGIDLFPNLAPQSTSAIHQWLSGGADVDLDIIPEMKRVHAKGLTPRGWGLFTQSIADAKTTREKPLPKGQPNEKGIRQPASSYRPNKSERAKAALLRSANALGYGPASRPGGAASSDESDLSVL